MTELERLRAEVNPRGWGVLHDPWRHRWYAVRGRAEYATAASAAELRARVIAVDQETVSMPVIE